MKQDIAVLITCFNRKTKTLKCLQNLKELDSPRDINSIDIYLVDDGSTDGTFCAVLEGFPDVNLIKGTGDLFWNKGMRLAWETASKTKPYDFYLWINDDVVLEKFALKELLNCYLEALSKNTTSSLITGAFKSSQLDENFSYGGRLESGAVIPNGKLQRCKYINGNAVLIPIDIFKVLGNLSSEYTHGMGDYDYGLRALAKGFNNYTTKRYIGYCPVNDEPDWANPKVPLRKRLEIFRSPTGLNYAEYIQFRKKYWGSKWIIYAIKAYAKVLFPSLYNKIIK